MGRKRKDIENVKTSRSIRLTPFNWKRIENEQKRLGNKYLTTTLEQIIEYYFKKK